MGARIGEKGVERKGGQKRKKIRKAPVTAAWAEPEPAVGGLVFSQKNPGRDSENPGPGRGEGGGRNWAMNVESGGLAIGAILEKKGG